jgi:hypothetical protein
VISAVSMLEVINSFADVDFTMVEREWWFGWDMAVEDILNLEFRTDAAVETGFGVDLSRSGYQA